MPAALRMPTEPGVSHVAVEQAHRLKRLPALLSQSPSSAPSYCCHLIGSRTNSGGQDIVRQIVAAVTAEAAVGVAWLRTRRS
ncbi:hypothetical protein [Micromonospora sp. NPDC006431]|uniref:hypothetical protein n=1 Tax=Micromonospora sp. NPDC006431 TaxID=3364235 RepID=UPI00367FBCAA